MDSLKQIKYAYIETTNYCNLKCSFCNRDEVIGSLKHMSLDKWQLYLDKIKHHPIEEVKLMGMGEPFLHPQFDEITKMFKEVFPNCFVIVATNCQYSIKHTLTMGKKFEKSLKNINMLYLSIDGFEKSYERDRAPAKWNKLIDFLEDLQEIDRSNCNIVVNYVINKENVYDIPKVENLIKKYNLNELRLNIAQDWSQEQKLENNTSWGYDDQQIAYLKQNYLSKIKGKTPWSWSDCFWVEEGLYTTVEGNIKMCCMNTSTTSFGNIFNNDLDTVRKSNSYQMIRSGCKLNMPTSHCKNCSYKELSPLLNKIGIKNC